MPTADPAHPISYSTALQQSNAKEGDASPTGISPTQNDKQVIHGIEVSQQIIYHGWEPGREYTKNIVLKNVAFKTQKLKFRLVKTRLKFHVLSFSSCKMFLWKCVQTL